MKTLKIVLLSSLVLCYADCKLGSLVPSAISEIVYHHFYEVVGKIDFIQYGNKTIEGENILRSLMSHPNKSIPLIVQLPFAQLWNSSVLVFETLEYFELACKVIWWQPHHYKRNWHLVYIIENITTDNFLQNVFNSFPLDNVNFLVNVTTESIDLVTSYMHTEQACKKHQVRTVNHFRRSTMAWDHIDFYPNKYKNMYGCPIVILVEFVDDIFGDLTMMKKFTKSLNGTPKFSQFDRRINPKYDTEIDVFALHVDVFDLLRESNLGTQMTQFIFIAEMVFYVPPGELYTPLEKMLLPFQEDFWTAIVVTLISGIVVIIVLNQTSRKIQNFCYGRNIKTPMVNMCSIVLTGAQNKVPRRNFSRFLLILFIWFSLIVRTCYQSELFKYLQANPRKPQVQSLQEMVEKNFTIETGRLYTEFLTNAYGIKFRNGSVCESLRECLEIVVEPANKHCVYGDKLTYERISHEYRSGHSSIKILKDPVIRFGVGYPYKASSPFNDMLNNFVLLGTESGLFKKLKHDHHFPKVFQRPIDELSKPEVLTMDHLEIAFKVSLFPLSFACLAFVLEWVVYLSKKWSRIFIDNLVMLSALKALMRIKRSDF